MIIFPPRPNSKIPPSQLGFYESLDTYVAQPKYNGTRNVIHVKDGEVKIFSRHGGEHRQYVLSDPIKEQILNLDLTENEYWLDSELMHNKTKNLKDKIVLFDVLQAGNYLFGVNQMVRLDLLGKICRFPEKKEEKGRAFEIFPNLWMAPTIDKHFVEAYSYYSAFEEIEGLVLRDKNSCLDNYGQKEYTIPWIVRCRKSNNSYSF